MNTNSIASFNKTLRHFTKNIYIFFVTDYLIMFVLYDQSYFMTFMEDLSIRTISGIHVICLHILMCYRTISKKKKSIKHDTILHAIVYVHLSLNSRMLMQFQLKYLKLFSVLFFNDIHFNLINYIMDGSISMVYKITSPSL